MFIYKLLGSDHYNEVTKSIPTIINNICTIWHVLTSSLPSTSSYSLIMNGHVGLAISVRAFWYLALYLVFKKPTGFPATGKQQLCERNKMEWIACQYG